MNKLKSQRWRCFRRSLFLRESATIALVVAAVTFAVFTNTSIFADEKASHWAWKSVKAPLPPKVMDEKWLRNSVDRFILAKLEAAGVPPAQPATREQLIRRASFDLTGLPPTPIEIDAFLNDTSPNAWEKVIDRLLASPHYGERWGRHWLDLARYADSNGYEYDEVRPDAWRYRDYVIHAFNDNKPYDRFVREQLAGDEFFPGEPEAIIATGFNLLGPDMTDSSDQIQRRQNTLNDMTDTSSLVFLGLTLGCARCHDHKFEPFPQTDYYRLQAFFTPAKFRKDVSIVPKEQRAAMDEALHKFHAQLRPVQEELHRLEEPYRKKLRDAKLAKFSVEVREAHETPERERTPAQRERVEETLRFVAVSQAELLNVMSEEEKKHLRELQEKIKAIEARQPSVPVAMGLQDSEGPPAKTYLLERGVIGNRGEEMKPGYPEILVNNAANGKSSEAKSPGGRATLANWIADPKNPLTARVMVNRLWQHHFGRGIVRTTSDFGTHGTAPTHPELLDWLAEDFTRNGWDIKRMHKLMMMSNTYSQSTQASPDAIQKDPDNNLFSRMNRVRLEGEIIRDNLLAVSGRLNPKLGGPGVFPPIPAEALKGTKAWTVSTDKSEHTRRSIYIFARRNLRFPFLEAFDLPDSNLSCPKRERSTTAPQALALLNAEDVVEAAKALAARLAKETTSDRDKITLMYRLILGRKPTAKETALAEEFIKESPWSELCRALFNVNEFVYLD